MVSLHLAHAQPKSKHKATYVHLEIQPFHYNLAAISTRNLAVQYPETIWSDAKPSRIYQRSMIAHTSYIWLLLLLHHHQSAFLRYQTPRLYTLFSIPVTPITFIFAHSAKSTSPNLFNFTTPHHHHHLSSQARFGQSLRETPLRRRSRERETHIHTERELGI